MQSAPLQRIQAPRESSQVVEEIAASTLSARAIFLFDGALREAMHRFKYEGKTVLAASLSQLMLEQLGASPENFDASTRALFGANASRENAPILVPVPLHSWRKWRRGYNQSELLARELSRLTNAPSLSLLRRTRFTTTQTELSREERLQNVEGAFALNEKAARVLALRKTPFSFVLIDDVYTTGATLEECARVLRLSFPTATVRAVTLAYQSPS